MADPEISLDGPKPGTQSEHAHVEDKESLLKQQAELQEKLQEHAKKMQELRELKPDGALALLLVLLFQWQNEKKLQENEQNLKSVQAKMPETAGPEGTNPDVGLKIPSPTEDLKVGLKNQEKVQPTDSTVIDNAIHKVEDLMKTTPKEFEDFDQKQLDDTQKEIQSLKNDLTTLLQKDIQQLESEATPENKKETPRPEPETEPEQDEAKKTTETPKPEEPKLDTKESVSPMTKMEETADSKSKNISETKQAFLDQKATLKAKILSTAEDAGELTGDPERDAQQVGKSIHKWFATIEELMRLLKTYEMHKKDKSEESKDADKDLGNKPEQEHEGNITLDSPKPSSVLDAENPEPPPPGSELGDEEEPELLSKQDLTPEQEPDFVGPGEGLDSSNLGERWLSATQRMHEVQGETPNPEAQSTPENGKSLTLGFETYRDSDNRPLRQITLGAEKLVNTQQKDEANTKQPSLKSPRPQ